MGVKTVKKPNDYKAKPTRQLARKIVGSDSHPLCFLDWAYISEAIRAHRACEKLAEYVTEKLCDGEPLSDEIVCYIVLGVDKDQLIEAVSKEREEAQKKMAEEDYEKLTPGTKIKVTGYKGEWAGEVEIMDATFEIMEGNYVAGANIAGFIKVADAMKWQGAV